MEVRSVDECVVGAEPAQAAGDVRAGNDEPVHAGELVRPLALPPEDLRAVRVRRRAARELRHPVGVLPHRDDVRLAARVEPRVEVRCGAKRVVDRADPGHLPGERDAGDVARAARRLERACDRSVRRTLDLVEVLLDPTRAGITECDLLESLAQDRTVLVDDRGLRPHRPEVAADEDGHRYPA